MLVAVIDAGTNTFTMNIYRLREDYSFEKMPKERYYVNLAEEGIAHIGLAAQSRAIAAFEAFRKTIDEQGVDKVLAFGTAALRRAKNAKALMAQIKKQTAIEIELIDGAREAELIYLGVKHAAPLTRENALIIDIGGGSVEFIICNSETYLWAKSFPIGVAHLYHQFVSSDPFSPEDARQLQNYLQNQLLPLEEALLQFPVKQLIGASGTFDALEAMIGTHQQAENYGYIALNQLGLLYEKLKGLDYQERKNYPKLPESRAKLIVVAMLLVNYLIQLAGIEDLIVSDYALREGALFDYIERLLK